MPSAQSPCEALIRGDKSAGRRGNDHPFELIGKKRVGASDDTGPEPLGFRSSCFEGLVRQPEGIVEQDDLFAASDERIR